MQTKSRGTACLTSLLRAYIRYFPCNAGKSWLWTQVIDPRFAWNSHEFVATTSFGSRMKGNSRDIIQQYIYYFGVWEPHLTKWISRQLKPGDTFVDVGANIGYFSLLAANLVGDSGSVIAIEASPQTFGALQNNLKLNDCRNVSVKNIAVSDKAGVLKIFRGPDCNIGISSTLETPELVFESEVEAAALTALVPTEEIKKIRLIKIDVEGAEWSVVKGMESLLDSCRKDLEVIVEVNPGFLARQGSSPEALLEIFAKRGFHAYQLENDYSAISYLQKGTELSPKRIRHAIEHETDIVFSRLDSELL